MTYATQQDLIDRYGAELLQQLTDRANSAAIDAGIVGKALAGADARIDSYLGQRYVLPLSPAPLIIVEQACVITRYLLHTATVPEHVADAYKDAQAWLKSVVDGSVSLAGAIELTAASADMPIVDAEERIFGRCAMRGY